MVWGGALTNLSRVSQMRNIPRETQDREREGPVQRESEIGGYHHKLRMMGSWQKQEGTRLEIFGVCRDLPAL